MARTEVEQILDEFNFGDGVVNAGDEDAERMAREVLYLRQELERREMSDLTRKYRDYGHGPQTPPATEEQ